MRPVDRDEAGAAGEAERRERPQDQRHGDGTESVHPEHRMSRVESTDVHVSGLPSAASVTRRITSRTAQDAAELPDIVDRSMVESAVGHTAARRLRRQPSDQRRRVAGPVEC